MRLGEIASVQTGPFGAQLHQNDYVKSDGTPIVTVEHLSERGLLHKNLPLVSNHDKERLNKFLIKTGDVVFSRVGSVDRSSLVSMNEDGWLFSGRLLRIRLYGNIVANLYLHYFFCTSGFKNYIKSMAVGGIMPSLNTHILNRVYIFYPPLAEQKTIASLLQAWDAAIEKTDALIVAKERQFAWLVKSLISDQVENPYWNKITLGQIGIISSAGVDKKIVSGEQSVRLLNYLDVFNRNLIFSDQLSHIVTASDNKIRTCSIQKGDVFFTPSSETREDIGYSAVAMEDIDNAVYSYHIIRLRPVVDIDLLYSAYAFKAHRFYKQVTKFANGSGQRYFVSQSDFRETEITLPPLSEQKRIAHILNTAQKEIDILKVLAKKYRTQKRGLMQKLLTGIWRVQT